MEKNATPADAIDWQLLHQEGKVPLSVYRAFQANDNKLLSEHRTPIVAYLTERYLKGETTLPSSELQTILNEDIQTRRQLQQTFASRKNQSERLVEESAPQSILQATLESKPLQPSITPMSWTVATVEPSNQVSDADFRNPTQTIEFRFNPVEHATPIQPIGSSDVEALKVAEQIQAIDYQLLLPTEQEHIRQYLQNDGYLSNEEITRALYDARLEKTELRDYIHQFDSSKSPKIIQGITDYLWDVHQSVMDHPLQSILDENSKFELVAMAKSLNGDLVRDSHVDSPRVDSPSVDSPQLESTHPYHQPTLSRLLAIKTFEGGMLANALHNYTIMKELTERMFGLHQPIHNQSQSMSQTYQQPPRYNWEQIAQQMESKGITRQILENSGNLDNLLRGRRTETITLERNDNGIVTPVTGRLYIAETPEKGPIVFLAAARKQLEMPNVFEGHKLSETDKRNLLKKGEMGRAVELKDKITGKTYMGLVGVDKENKRLTVMRQERFTPPIRLKGVDITPKQQQVLANHGTIRVKGLKDDRSERRYTADVSISVNKRQLVIKPVREKQALSAKNLQVNQQGNPIEDSTKQAKKSSQQKQTQLPENGDSKAKVSIQHKNGQRRVTVDKASNSQSNHQESQPTHKNTVLVNGVAKQETQQPKRRVKL